MRIRFQYCQVHKFKKLTTKWLKLIQIHTLFNDFLQVYIFKRIQDLHTCVCFGSFSPFSLVVFDFLDSYQGPRAASMFSVQSAHSLSASLAPSDPTRWCAWHPPRWIVWVPVTLVRRPSAVVCWGSHPRAPRQVARHFWGSPPPEAAGLGDPETRPRGAASCQPTSGGFAATWIHNRDLLPVPKTMASSNAVC